MKTTLKTKLFKRSTIVLIYLLPFAFFGCGIVENILSITYNFNPNYTKIAVLKIAKQKDKLALRIKLSNTKSKNISINYMTVSFYPTKLYLESIDKQKIEIGKILSPKTTLNYDLASDVLEKNHPSELYLHIAVFKGTCVNMKKLRIK